MLTNIENQMTKDKMDDLAKFDFTKMTFNLDNLNDKIKSIKTSTKSNSDEISDIKLSMQSLEDKVIKNIASNNNSDLNIKIAMNQMLNNVEFNNIYSLLNNNKAQNVDFSEDLKQKCSEIADNKIKTELEKFKIENENLWKKAVEANEKLNKPGEIQQIIDQVPPTVLPINDSAKRIMDVDYFNGQNENPKVPALDDKLKLIEGEDNNNINNNDMIDKEEKEKLNEKKNKDDESDINDEDNKEKEEKENKEDSKEEESEDKDEENNNKENEKQNEDDNGEKESKESNESKNESEEKESKKSKESNESKNESEEKESKNDSGEKESKNESEEKEDNEEEEEDNED